MRKSIIMFFVKIRWLYFHVSPSYVKFYMDSSKTEAHFQHVKIGSIHSNFIWLDDPVDKEG